MYCGSTGGGSVVVVDSGGASVVVVVEVLDVVVVEEVDVVVLLVLEVVDEVLLLEEDDEVVVAPVPPLHAAAIRAIAMGAANRRIWFSRGAAHGNPCETQRNRAWDTPRMPDPNGFSFVTRSNGEVVISHHGRSVTTLRGRSAERFLRRVDTGDDQQVMARATGNYRRGTER